MNMLKALISKSFFDSQAMRATYRLTRLLQMLFMLLCLNPKAYAKTFDLPDLASDSLIGANPDYYLTTKARAEDTLLDIARRFDVGQNEILLANPKVDRWLPGAGAKVKLPNSRLLPNAPRQGLVLNLPEYRLYYYPDDSEKEISDTVTTHPVSIGRQNWNTPLGITKITAKIENPTWIPPESIRKEHAAKGEILPAIVPAGPDNPLGLFKIRLGIPGYLIHSTNKPYGVGMRVSHGCIRMYPEDIERLFPRVTVGTPVHIVNQPIKAGWRNNTLYIEVHPDLEEVGQPKLPDLLDRAMDIIIRTNNNQLPVIDGLALNRALQQRNGIPVPIFQRPDEFSRAAVDVVPTESVATTN